jgi:hypothetical protein
MERTYGISTDAKPNSTSFPGKNKTSGKAIANSIKYRFEEADFTYTELHREDTELHRELILIILWYPEYSDSRVLHTASAANRKPLYPIPTRFENPLANTILAWGKDFVLIKMLDEKRLDRRLDF